MVRGCRQTIPIARSGPTASGCIEAIILGITPQYLRSPLNPDANHRHRANPVVPEALETG